MKLRRFLMIVGLGILFGLLIWVGISGPKSGESSAIRWVMVKHRLAAEQARRGPGDYDSALYLSGLRSISTANCPQEFRIAFLRYVQAVERIEQAKAPLSVLASGAALWSGDFRPVASDLAAWPDHAEAFRALRLSALKFGVDY